MAHRTAGHEWAACSDGEGGDEGGEGRGGLRRGKYSSPVGTGALLEENRRLYMDNLRLWDCLTLIRGDPALTCQGAINLVFSLGDNDYMRAFPDTNHLFQLRFPHGVVYHPDMEEAKSENSRLKDENARLHAAVWVLRDNPSLQADSTVAAIFRLDEIQFQYKFHVDLDTMNLGMVKLTDNAQYQNNNKARRRSYRASLDMGNEINMAIQLTNRPLKVGYSSRRSRSLSDRAQNGTVIYSPAIRTRKRSGSVVQQKDFTSNWKPTSPRDGDRILGLPGEDEFIDRLHQYVSPAYSCQSWQRHSCFGPVYQCATDGGNQHSNIVKRATQQLLLGQHEEELTDLENNDAEAGAECQHGKLTNNPTMANTPGIGIPGLSSPGDHKGSTEQFSRNDNLGLLTALCENRDPRSQLLNLENHQGVSSQPPTVGRNTITYGNSGTKQSMPGVLMADCSFTKLLEPSKRHQREVASNPLLMSYNSLVHPPNDTGFCFSKPTVYDHDSALIRDFRLLNTSSNNDSSQNRKGSPGVSSVPPSIVRSRRPNSAKSRDFMATRKTNLKSESSSHEPTLFESTPRVQFVPIDGNSPKKLSIFKQPVVTTAVPQRRRRISSFSLPVTEDQILMSKRVRAVSTTLKWEDTNLKPQQTDSNHSPKPAIFLSARSSLTSDEYTMTRQYSLNPYTTVKHYLERQRQLQEEDDEGSRLPKGATITFFTRDKSPSFELDMENPYNRWKRSLDSFEQERTHSQKPLIKRRNTGYFGSPVGGRSRTPTAVTFDTTPEMPVMPVGKLKECQDPSACKMDAKLRALKRMGRFQYTKPLEAMLKRNNNCEPWKPISGTPCQAAAQKLATAVAESRAKPGRVYLPEKGKCSAKEW